MVRLDTRTYFDSLVKYEYIVKMKVIVCVFKLMMCIDSSTDLNKIEPYFPFRKMYFEFYLFFYSE